MRALLDVNVLIALHDAQHVHHKLATDWFEAHADAGWASCPITQNGCLRIMSQPAYPNAQSADVLMRMLARSCAAPYHEFWADDVSLADPQRFRADNRPFPGRRSAPSGRVHVSHKPSFVSARGLPRVRQRSFL